MKKYFTLNSEELGEESKVNTLSELYKEWLRYKEDDKEYHDKKNYYFVKHEVENGIDTITEGKIYKRNNKIYFKPL